MKLNCTACGYKIDLGEAYDDYEGEVKCFACRALLEIRTDGGNIKTVKFLKFAARPTAEENRMTAR